MHWATVALCALVAVVVGPELYFRFLRPTCSWDEYRGEWALVTGSSFGIGRAFALELAKRGLNVVLHARTRSKLEQVAAEVRAVAPGVQVRVIVQDAVNDPQWDSMAAQIAALGGPVTVLINNIGGGNPAYDGTFAQFHAFSLEHHAQVQRFNWDTTFRWTHLLLGGMHARGRGRIISCSSLGYMFGYQESVYGATKGALHGLTHTINNEYYYAGVRAEALLIGLVSTPAFGNMPTDVWGFISTPELLAPKALDLFGWKEIYPVTLGHAVSYYLGSLLPLKLRVDATIKETLAAQQALLQGRSTIDKIHLADKRAEL